MSQQQKINASKKGERNGRVWTSPLLERLSSRLSVRTVNIGDSGSSGKKKCPDHYAYDLVIPLVHASRVVPLGWILFTAKYLGSNAGMAALRQHVAAELPDHRFTVSLVDLVVDNYCHGVRVSGRSLRRQMDIGRADQRRLHKAMERVLANLHAVESHYAHEVRKRL
jgi:hypothetical protein